MSNLLNAKGGQRVWRPALVALCLISVLISVGFISATPHSAYAQSNEFHFQSYNTDLTINADGTVDVTETLIYRYDIGTFRRGLREIPLGRVERITNVRVAEQASDSATLTDYRETSFNPDGAASSGVPGTFGTIAENNNLRIRWIYPPTSFSARTFVVRYRLEGAIRVYEDNYQLQWFAIPRGAGAPIDSASVNLKVPPGVEDINNLPADANPKTSEYREGDRITWAANRFSNDLSKGMEARVRLPKNVMQATKPGWQDAADLQERMQPFIDMGLLGSGLLILIFGPLWAVRKWYKYGRDLPVTLHSDYVADTPSDLPPGLVGTLLDESADVRDVIATIVDQGRKGNLTINELESQGILSSTKEFQYKQTGSKTDYRFEQMVLDAVFQNGPETSLSDMKNTFYKDLPPIYSEMYGELVRLNYFPEDPSAVRTRYIMGGIGFIVLGALVVGASYLIGGGITFFPMIPAVALGITGLVRMGIARSMPRKTDFGSEEAQKWRAFQRYLEEIQRYTDVQAAADKFQKYLPYAVALGVEKQLTAQFNSVPAAMPPYYIPYGWYPYGANPMGTSASGTSVGDGGLGNFDPGAAMQTMSDSFGSAMQSMSDSFTDMVNSASSILTSQPSSSGSSSSSGWGGGGGSSWGGGGGGGTAGAD